MLEGAADKRPCRPVARKKGGHDVKFPPAKAQILRLYTAEDGAGDFLDKLP